MSCRSRCRVALAAALAGLSLLCMAACSSSSGTPNTSFGDAASTGSQLDKSNKLGSPIKIGYAVAASGVASPTIAASLPTAEAWAHYVNASGGIAGHRVQIVVGDTQSNPVTAQAVVKKMVEQDKVVAVMVSDTVSETALQPYLSSQHIAVLDGSGYSPFWFEKPNFYGTSVLGTTVIGSMVPAAKSVGSKNLIAAVCSDTAGCQAFSAILAPTAQKAGINYLGLVEISSSATDYTAPCLQFQQKKAEFIDVTTEVNQSKALMTQCIQQGYQGWFGTGATGFTPEAYKSVSGMKMAGTINGFPWWVSDPAVETYRKAMTTYEPNTDYQTSGSTAVWASLQLFGKAMANQTGAVTKSSAISAMNDIKNETLGGLLPQPITFTAGQPAPTVNCYWQYTYKAGDKDPVAGGPSDGKAGNGVTGDLASTCTS